MKDWTVVGYYRDNNQPWMEFVKAETAQRAALAAVSMAPDSVSSTDRAVVEVVEGNHKGCLLNEEVLFEDGLQALAEAEEAGTS